MRLFYYPSTLFSGKVISFDFTESKHIAKVLRLQKDDTIHVTSGNGELYNAKLIDDNVKQCKAELLNEAPVNKPKRPYFHLFVAPPKSKQRWEWLLEKVTEIGVDEITPITCEKSERDKIDNKRTSLMLINALKQSQQVKLPLLNSVSSFDQVITQKQDALQLIAHCNDDISVYSIDDFTGPIDMIEIFIGPEGDFSFNEIDLALKKQYFALSLGENRLRTETAAIVAAQMVASIHK